MKLKLLVIMLLVVNMLYGGGFFSEYRLGSRGSVLGAGYVGIADDGGCIFMNLGGLGQMRGVEVFGLYSKPYSVVDFGMVVGGLIYSLDGGGVVGGGLMQYNYGGLASEGVYVVGYGKEVSRGVYVGGGIKVLSLNILADIDEEGYNKSKSGFSVDGGLIYYVGEGISLGFSIRNLVPVDITLGKEATEKETVGMEVMGGVGYRMKMQNGWLVMSGGVINSYDGLGIDLGGEYWMEVGNKGMVGLRGGYVGGGIGLGGSYKQDKLRVDVSYIISNAIKNSSGFNIGIGYMMK